MWTPHGPEIVGANPLLERCGFCGAPAGVGCTRPTRRGRRPATATHAERYSQLTA